MVSQIQLEIYLSPSADSSGAFMRKVHRNFIPKSASEQSMGLYTLIFITNPSADFVGLDLVISS